MGPIPLTDLQTPLMLRWLVLILDSELNIII